MVALLCNGRRNGGGDNKLTKNKNKTKAHDWKDKEAKSTADRKSRSVRQNARGNKNPIRFL